MPKVLRWTIAIGIFIAVIVWVEQTLSWKEVFTSWSRISIASLVGLTLLTFLSYFLRAFRVFWYFGRLDNHPLLSYVRISFLHNAWNNFLPMRLGEASFPIMMKREFDCSLIKSGAGLLWIRLMDLHWLLVLLSGIAIMQLGYWASIALLGLLVGPFMLLALVSSPLLQNISPLAKLIEKLRLYAPDTYLSAIKLYFLTAAIWTVKLAALTVIMLSFIELPTFQGILAVVSADLSSVLPIHGLAGSGTYEAAMLAALVPLGVDSDSVLMAAINVHMYILVATLMSVPVAVMIPKTNGLETRTSDS